jgi:hypothetical protein
MAIESKKLVVAQVSVPPFYNATSAVPTVYIDRNCPDFLGPWPIIVAAPVVWLSSDEHTASGGAALASGQIRIKETQVIAGQCTDVWCANVVV